MADFNIQQNSSPPEAESPPVQKGLVPFALGFRPFFLLASVAAALLMLVWVLQWNSAITPGGYYGNIGWHAHEMLFGYTVAVIAGFLLTAVRNWTGIDTITDTPLALLATLWLAGRVLPWIADIPGWLIASVDLAFLPLLAVALSKPLWLGNNKINRIFLPLLLAMGAANLLIHLQALDLANLAPIGQSLALQLVLLILLIVGGRVLPFFTQNVIPGFQASTTPWIERSGFILIGLLLLSNFIGSSILSNSLYMLLGITQLLRLRGWYHKAIWNMPVLWILHLGYAWIGIGSLLMGFSMCNLLMPSAAQHALTAGAIGITTLGMMARVALGHSGRSIQVSRLITISFLLINLAVLLRVLGVSLLPAWYMQWIALSGLLWIASFTLFAWVYLPILVKPRIDGKPG